MEKAVIVQFLQTKNWGINQEKAEVPLERIIKLCVQNTNF